LISRSIRDQVTNEAARPLNQSLSI
jgi:hypothetical protein